MKQYCQQGVFIILNVTHSAIRSSHFYSHLYEEESQACQIIEDESNHDGKELLSKQEQLCRQKTEITITLRKNGCYSYMPVV